jgi:myo-inositol-1(or 4)-monophosphatase
MKTWPSNLALGPLGSFAVELAAAARQETLPRSREPLAIDDKGPDGLFDPVTESDRAAEQVIRRLIADRYPDHGICGEEFDDQAPDARCVWSIDPIDGTRSYICGLPTWTTLIALLEDGVPVVGLIDAPRLDETYVGTNREAIVIREGEASTLSTSGCKRIREARFSTTDPFLFGPRSSALQRVLGAVRVTRYGHDGYAYARLAGGTIDLVIECGLKPHDYNALIPVIRGAKGHVGDWAGGTDFTAGDIIAAASRELYDAAVELLAEV